jgi:hypothetical protein
MHKIHITAVLYNCKSIRSVVWPKLYDALHEEPSGANMLEFSSDQQVMPYNLSLVKCRFPMY